MRRKCQIVDRRSREIDFDFSDRLNGVGVEQDTALLGNLCDSFDREDHPRFVVRPHHRDEDRFVGDCCSDTLGTDITELIHIDKREFCSVFFEEVEGFKNRWMFYRRGDDVVFGRVFEDMFEKDTF